MFLVWYRCKQNLNLLAINIYWPSTCIYFVNDEWITLAKYEHCYLLSDPAISMLTVRRCHCVHVCRKDNPGISSMGIIQGFYSPRGTSHLKISWSLETARFRFRLLQLLWNLTRDFSSSSARDVCQISEWYRHYHIQSCFFGTSRDLAVRRLTA